MSPTCSDSYDYYNNLRNLFIEQIITNLTFGREDDNLEPYNNEQINNFIVDNNDKITNAINSMIKDYTDEDELEDLKEPYGDWIREYLYEYIEFPDN
jgi:hypothetical protein